MTPGVTCARATGARAACAIPAIRLHSCLTMTLLHCCRKRSKGAAGRGGIPLFPLRRCGPAPPPGLCRVICFSPRHDLTLPELSLPEVEAVVHAWTGQTRDLGARDFVNYVQVFENKGEMMGCSNPHPHSQVWASGHIQNEPAKELAAQADYLREHRACVLCDYLR